MARKTSSLATNKKAWILLVIILTFIAGFLVARTRYKPQIQESYNMVMEREGTISELQDRIVELENKIELEGIEF